LSQFSVEKDSPWLTYELAQGAGTPRWVRVFGTIFLVVVVVFVILMVAGGTKHGPGRHMKPAADRGAASP